MSVESDIIILQNQIDNITAALANTISGQEMVAAVSMLEQDMAKVTSSMSVLDPRVTRMQTQVNSVTLRFKRYASNEQAIINAGEALPTLDEKLAMAGTSGTPSGSNEFVTREDPGMSNERLPLAHAVRHGSGEPDEILHQALRGAGVLTHPQLEQDLVIIHAEQVVQDDRATAIEADVVQNASDVLALNADTLPAGVVRQIPTVDEVGRILPDNIFSALVSSGIGSTETMLVQSVADLLYSPILPSPYATHQYLDTLTQGVRPNIDNSYDLGSPTRAWRRIYAYEFIDVDGNSLVIKDKHFGYNGGTELSFGDDAVVLRPELTTKLSAIVKDAGKVMERVTDSALSLQTVVSAVREHSSSTQHDDRYFTKHEIKEASLKSSSIFSSYLKLSSKCGIYKSIDNKYRVDWKSLVNKPEYLSQVENMSKFKGTIYSLEDLNKLDVIEGDFLFMHTNERSDILLVKKANNEAGVAYVPLFDPSRIQHGSIAGTHRDTAHPQYLLRSALQEALVDSSVSIKAALNMTTGHKFLSDSDASVLRWSSAHIADRTNPHGVTYKSVGAIQDSMSSVRPHHLSSDVTLDCFNSGDISKRFTLAHISSIKDSQGHSESKSLHWNSDIAEHLLTGQDTDIHYHTEDRRLENATGTLSWDKVEDTVVVLLSEKLKQVDTFAIELGEYTHEFGHAEKHLLASHDTSVTGEELDNLQSIHYKKSIGDAHNASFGNFGGVFGRSAKVARADHTHDEYLVKAHIFTAMKDSDSIGTIKCGEDYLYIKNSKGWNKVKLELVN